MTAEKSPLVTAAEALADRAKALAEAIGPNVSAKTVLLLAAKTAVLADIAAAKFDGRRERYAKRICLEHGHDINLMVTSAHPAAVAIVMGANYTIAPHWDYGPLWVQVYARLPSLGGIENEIELHQFDFDEKCSVCGITQIDIDDNQADKFICIGPCTEPRLMAATRSLEVWQHPNGQRYHRAIGTHLTEETERDFNAWKSGATVPEGDSLSGLR